MVGCIITYIILQETHAASPMEEAMEHTMLSPHPTA